MSVGTWNGKRDIISCMYEWPVRQLFVLRGDPAFEFMKMLQGMQLLQMYFLWVWYFDEHKMAAEHKQE